MSATPASMETDTNNDDDELFEEADEDEDAETPPSTEDVDVKMDIPKNLRDSLGSGRRDAAPAGFTSTKRARKATARFADLEAKGQSYSQADDDAASSPRPPPRKKAPPKATTEKKPKRPRAPPAPPTVKRQRKIEERVPATAEQLQGLSIKELKALADKRKVDLTGCAEKGDLVHALVAARVLLPPSAAPAAPPAPAPRAPEPGNDAPMPPLPADEADDAAEAKRERARKRRRERAAAAKAERERAAAPPPPPPAVVTIDDDDMAPGDDDGVAPAPAAPTHDSEIAAWAALAPRGVREAWEKAGLDFGQQLREAFSGSSDATELDVPAALKQAGELETVALGLRFFAAVGAKSPRADDVRITDKVRQAYPLVDVRYAQAKSGELSLMDALKELAPARLRLAGLMRVLDAARERGDVRARLRGLGARNCLRGEEVVVTGVCELLGGREDNRGDTRRELIECIEQLGGTCKSDVTGTDAKQGTTLLVVGLGEKGVDGKRNGRGEAPETSGKFRKATEINSKRAAKRHSEEQKRRDREEAMRNNSRLKKPHEVKSVPPDIRILREDEFYAWVASLPAQRARDEEEDAGPKTTAPPRVFPDLRRIHYTHPTKAAHAMGEPGKEGGFLADALAPPGGFTLENAIVASGEHLDGAFAHAMLQRCSCADGAGGSRGDLVRNDVPSYVTVHWEGADRHAGPGDKPEKEWRSEPKGWLAATAKPGYHTRRGRPFESCRQVDLKHAEKVRKKRAKPALGAQFGLLADATIGMGQAHSKFWLLRFKPAAEGRSGGVVRLVISSGNCRPVAYAAHPKRELVGLWFADFKEVDGAAPSPFRDALLRHCRALVNARSAAAQADFARTSATRADALARCEELFAACERADFSPADAAGVRLVAHEPGLHPRGAGVAAEALRAAFAEACVEAGGGPLNCSAVCHSYGGWLEGGATGRARLSRLKSAMAPGGGDINVFWPERGDKQLFRKDRSTENVGLKYATQDRGLEQIKAACAGEALTRLRVAAHANERGADKYVYTPHLMLYVLHDAAGGIKRLLLSSANLSAAAWGRRRSHKFPNDENALPTDEGALEVRSFELGVSVPPADADRAKEDLPFVFPAAAAGQCQREFIGVNSLDRDDRGVMHY